MIRVIETAGTPRRMGEEYGEAMRLEIQLSYELWADWFRRYPVSDEFVRNVRHVLTQYAPEILEEMSGLAAGAGVEENFIFATNFTDTFGHTAERCTPVFVRTADNHILLAKNNDAPPEEKFPFVVRKGIPTQGLPFIQITYAGWLSGLDMMNSEGLANTHASVGSVFPKEGLRLDIRLGMYQLMQKCRTVEELTNGLREIPLTGKGFAIAAGDIHNHALFIDAAVPILAVRSGKDDFAWATNLYMAPEVHHADMRPADRRKHCLKRYEYISEKTAPQNIDDLKALLSDHSSPYAPCRHGGEQLSETKWSMIADLHRRTVLYTDGNPCNNPYEEISL